MLRKFSDKQSFVFSLDLTCVNKAGFSRFEHLRRRPDSDGLSTKGLNHLHFEEDLALYLFNFEFLSPKKDDLYKVWLKLTSWFWRRKFLKKKLSVFLLFCYYLLLEKSIPFHLTNSNSLDPRMIICQVWLKLTQWFCRRSRKYKTLQTDG
jgi:hypothetical protein